MGNKLISRKIADRTREKILAAAHKLFVAKGYSATSISMIAKAAKINQSLIYHHFNNKENLWRLIKMEPLAEFQELKGLDIPTIIAIDDAANFIEKLVMFRFELYDNNPDLRRIIDWQYLENDSAGLKGFSKETIINMLAQIKKFQAQGQMIATYDPKIILISLLNFPLTYFRGIMGLPKELLETSKQSQDQLKQDFLSLCLVSLKQSLIA